MPGTKRRRIGPARINRSAAPWVADWLAGISPPTNSAEDIALCEWTFGWAPVAGLPPRQSPEGCALLAQHEAAKADLERRDTGKSAETLGRGKLTARRPRSSRP
jgi:hypothetical protein